MDTSTAPETHRSLAYSLTLKLGSPANSESGSLRLAERRGWGLFMFTEKKEIKIYIYSKKSNKIWSQCKYISFLAPTCQSEILPVDDFCLVIFDSIQSRSSYLQENHHVFLNNSEKLLKIGFKYLGTNCLIQFIPFSFLQGRGDCSKIGSQE